jgi:hypothetical protein
MQGCWQLVNFDFYRETKSIDAVRKQQWRSRSAASSGVQTVQDSPRTKHDVLDKVPRSAPAPAQISSSSNPDREGSAEESAPAAPPPAAVAAPKSKRARRVLSDLPLDFEPNESCQALAAERGVSLSIELPAFIDYHAREASRFADWQAAMRTWLRRAKPQGGTAGAQQTLRHQFPPDWQMHEKHMAEGKRLGLTEAEIWARLDDCLHKPIKQGFLSEDDHFMRELAWAKCDKEAEKAKRESYANRKDFETPGHRRNA